MLISALLDKYIRWTVKRHARGTSRAMFLSALTLKDKFPNHHYYSDYAKLALTTRPGWKQLGESFFEHNSGLGFEISENHSLKQVIRSVVEIELRSIVFGRADAETLISSAITEVDNYFSRSQATSRMERE